VGTSSGRTGQVLARNSTSSPTWLAGCRPERHPPEEGCRPAASGQRRQMLAQRVDVAGWVKVAGAGAGGRLGGGAGQRIEDDRRAPGRRPRGQAGQRVDDGQALDQRRRGRLGGGWPALAGGHIQRPHGAGAGQDLAQLADVAGWVRAAGAGRWAHPAAARGGCWPGSRPACRRGRLGEGGQRWPVGASSSRTGQVLAGVARLADVAGRVQAGAPSPRRGMPGSGIGPAVARCSPSSPTSPAGCKPERHPPEEGCRPAASGQRWPGSRPAHRRGRRWRPDRGRQASTKKEASGSSGPAGRRRPGTRPARAWPAGCGWPALAGGCIQRPNGAGAGQVLAQRVDAAGWVQVASAGRWAHPAAARGRCWPGSRPARRRGRLGTGGRLGGGAGRRWCRDRGRQASTRKKASGSGGPAGRRQPGTRPAPTWPALAGVSFPRFAQSPALDGMGAGPGVFFAPRFRASAAKSTRKKGRG
jgi:hypothetical protein